MDNKIRQIIALLKPFRRDPNFNTLIKEIDEIISEPEPTNSLSGHDVKMMIDRKAKAQRIISQIKNRKK